MRYRLVLRSSSPIGPLRSTDSQPLFEIGSWMNSDVFTAFTDNPWQGWQSPTHPTFAFTHPLRKLRWREEVIKGSGVGFHPLRPR
jgi:hypothetical protein